MENYAHTLIHTIILKNWMEMTELIQLDFLRDRKGNLKILNGCMRIVDTEALKD